MRDRRRITGESGVDETEKKKTTKKQNTAQSIKKHTNLNHKQRKFT